MLMASSPQINGFMYTFIHRSFIEWLLCVRPNIKSGDKEIQETFFQRKKKKKDCEATKQVRPQDIYY